MRISFATITVSYMAGSGAGNFWERPEFVSAVNAATMDASYFCPVRSLMSGVAGTFWLSVDGVVGDVVGVGVELS